MTNNRRGRFRPLTALLAAALAAAPIAALAQGAYPSRPVKTIVPFPPGGSFDVVVRIVLQDIAEQRGWQYVVENRPGADGQLGVIAAARSEPDGYTLVAMTSISHASAPALKASLGYDPVNDLAPVVLLADAPLVLLVKKDVPARSLADLLKLMREQPGKLNYGTGGGSSQHYFATQMLLQRAGLPATAAVHVPFQGIAPAVLALIAGTTDFMFASTGNATQNIATGTLFPLVLTAAKRSPALPDVPTTAETGFPGLEIAPWVALAAPAKTPQAIVEQWNKAANESMAKPAIRDKILAVDYEVRGGTPADLARFAADDRERYRKLVEDLKIERK